MIKLLARYVLRDEIAAAQKQLDLATETLANPLLTGINIGNGSIDIGLEGGGATLVAGMFVGMLDDPRAPNFVEVTFSSAKHGPIYVTVQRQSGKTPATLLREAKEEIERLRSEIK